MATPRKPTLRIAGPKLRPTIAKGRAHQYGRRVAFEAQGAKNAVLTSAELVGNSPGGQKCKVGVRFGVVADAMAAIGDLAHQFGTSMGEAAHQEKCCLDLVPFQKIEELRRERRIRPIIEGERDLRGVQSMVQAWDRKAPTSRKRRPKLLFLRRLPRPTQHKEATRSRAHSRTRKLHPAKASTAQNGRHAGITFGCKIAS